MKILFVSFAISLVTSSVMAESGSNLDALMDRWSADNGVYITKKARKDAHEWQAIVDDPRGAPMPQRAPEDRSTSSLWLVRFPTIRLNVNPTAPRDYVVSINGEDCPATEKGLY